LRIDAQLYICPVSLCNPIDVDVAKPRQQARPFRAAPAPHASSTRLDQISTKTVHKFVEKHPLDMPKPSRNAGSNNLPVAWAKLNLRKINELPSQVTHVSRIFAR
jgi:hypothetical protein